MVTNNIGHAHNSSTASSLPTFQAGSMYVLPVPSLHIPSLIRVIFLTGPEVVEVLCVPSSSSQQASGVNFNFVMTMVSTSTLKMHVTHNWPLLIVGIYIIPF